MDDRAGQRQSETVSDSLSGSLCDALSSSSWAPLEKALIEARHDIHQHPELGFEEERTQEKVRAWLEARGYAPRVSAETGLVADLFPERYGKSKTIALRADLDALPMDEKTPLPYRSVHPGRAHKCGHDGHTAIMMGVADVLARKKDVIEGNVRLIFQPAEEGVRGGGAKVMVAEGVLEQVSEIYGLHNWPAWPLGELRVKAGPLMANVTTMVIELEGKGAHGSQPQVSKDPIVAGAHLVTALQTVVSRSLGYEGGAVVSICQFLAGEANNVIPRSARLTGTIRTFDAAVTDTVRTRVMEVCRGVEAMFGVKVKAELQQGYPVLINDPTCAEAVKRVGETVVERVSEKDLPMAGGEDFAYFAQQIPAAYFFLGAGKPGEKTPGCHHPDFDFEDRLLRSGVQMFVGLVNDRLLSRRT